MRLSWVRLLAIAFLLAAAANRTAFKRSRLSADTGRPRLDGVTALVLRGEGIGLRLVTEPRDIAGFREAGFSARPLRDVQGDRAWLRCFDGEVIGVDKDGSCVIWILCVRAGSGASLIDWLLDNPPFMQVDREYRYFPLGERWCRWRSAFLVAHPRLEEIVVEVPMPMSLEEARSRTRALGIAPEFAYWSGTAYTAKAGRPVRQLMLIWRERPASHQIGALRRALMEERSPGRRGWIGGVEAGRMGPRQ